MAERYRIIEEIGRGAMGRVYLAHDSLLERNVALKELAVPDYLSDAEKEEVRERFRLEAKAAARLTHPHILTVHDILATGERQFIVMEYLEGKTLREILAERTFSAEEVASIASMIGEALDYAHSNGIIHRDVKPDNIFVLENGNIKVADFGIAKMLKVSDHTHTDVIMGTPNYIAPELVKSMAYDHRVDIFSLGVTLYETLSGKRPFDADNDFAIIFKVASEEPVPLDEYRKDLPPSLVRAVHRALRKNPERRYPGMREFREDLMRVRAELGMDTASEEESFDKEKALREELEAAKGLAVEGAGFDVEASEGYDFRRDREWKQLIARVYHGEEDVAAETPVASSGSGTGGERREDSEARLARGPAAARAGKADAAAESDAGSKRAFRPASGAAAHPVPRPAPRPVAPSAPAVPARLPRVKDPRAAARWGAAAVGAGAALIVSAAMPWIGKGLNPTRALMGMRFPEGIAVAVLTALVWGAGTLLLLNAGNPRVWLRSMNALSFLCILLVLLFFGLRIIGGVGYDKPPGLDAAAVIQGVGWGLWLALAASITAYVACQRFGGCVS